MSDWVQIYNEQFEGPLEQELAQNCGDYSDHPHNCFITNIEFIANEYMIKLMADGLLRFQENFDGIASLLIKHNLLLHSDFRLLRWACRMCPRDVNEIHPCLQQYNLVLPPTPDVPQFLVQKFVELVPPHFLSSTDAVFWVRELQRLERQDLIPLLMIIPGYEMEASCLDKGVVV